MSLNLQLQRFAEAFAERCPPTWGQNLQEAMRTLQAEDWRSRLAKVGAPAPDWSLVDLDGRRWSQAEACAQGPVILCFVRGGWCPYCTLELRAYQALLPKLNAANVQLLVISPEDPERARAHREANGLSMPILLDEDFEVSQIFGLRFEPPVQLRPIMKALEHLPEQVNAQGTPHLLIPATVVIDADARVIEHFAEMDYRQRLEPEQALATAMGTAHIARPPDPS